MKCGAIRGAYSDYTPETVQRYEGTILKMVLLGLLGTSLCPQAGNNSKKGHIKYDSSHFMMPLSQDLNFKPAKPAKFYACQYFSLYGILNIEYSSAGITVQILVYSKVSQHSNVHFDHLVFVLLILCIVYTYYSI